MILANDKPNPTLHLDEKTNVEAPFLDQLAGLGWDVIRLQQVQTPEHSWRASFDRAKPRHAFLEHRCGATSSLHIGQGLAA